MNKIIFAATLIGLGAISAPAFAQDAEAPTRIFTDPSGFEAKETPGGYEPAKPPLPANIKAGTRVRFVPQPLTPTEAYPPPPALKAYPPCRGKREDKCEQGRVHKQHRARWRHVTHKRR